jgi:DHA2 family methylenomycin A resistance protein-like MFS transporter
MNSVPKPSPAARTAAAAPEPARGGSPLVLGAALLGFFLISLDALIVTVALPDIGRSLGGGMSGLQRVVDGYTLMFAALMLSAGALSDRIGARRAFGGGLVLFALAVPADRAGTAGAVLNTGRQVGGAIAVAVFGALLAGADTFLAGMRWSMLVAAAGLVLTAGATLTLPRGREA